ncbi:MAG TPA: response regulator [Bacteroidota bacterium]|nr:response regulator [Bacteroidota bacterium]
MDIPKHRILLVEDNKDFAKLVQVYLSRFDKDLFEVVWRENYEDTVKALDEDKSFDIILMDYFLPGKNGLAITRELKERKINIPIVFLTVNKDFDLAIDVMKLGVDDYLVKEEITSPILPKTVLAVIEKHRLLDQLTHLELSRQRLRAVHDTLRTMVQDFETPLGEMRVLSGEFKHRNNSEQLRNYIKIIDDNVNRIIEKLEKLKSLKEYKTIKYIKDIKMIDLS